MADLIISLAMPKYPPHHPTGSDMMTEEASREALKMTKANILLVTVGKTQKSEISCFKTACMHFLKTRVFYPLLQL